MAAEYGLLTFAENAVKQHLEKCKSYQPVHETEIRRYEFLYNYILSKIQAMPSKDFSCLQGTCDLCKDFHTRENKEK